MYLVFRRKPWSTFDSNLDGIEVGGKKLPNILSQSIYCLGIIIVLIIDWVNIILDMLYIRVENLKIFYALPYDP